MKNIAAERRRSDRLWLTIPLRVEGADSNGQIVGYTGRAISLNRHGGRIQIPQELDWDHSIRLRSPMGQHEAEFRVVETIASHEDRGCECGVECLDKENNFWGIEFPSHEDQAVDAKVLLECGMCHTVALMPLTFLEIATLRTIGMVGMYCSKCGAETPWRYAEMRVPACRQPEQPWSSVEREARCLTSITESAGRVHRRVYMQMPLWIHAHYGDSDYVRIENISRIGFSFSSERKYLQGEIVRAAFPIASMSLHAKISLRIVREQPIEGSTIRFYGATFESRTSSKPVRA